MRELKLKYFLDLVSNVGAKSQAEAKLMQQAQEAMKAAIAGTNQKLVDYDKIVLRAGKNTGLVNQAIVLASGSAAALDRALGRLGSNTTLERQARYAQGLAARYTDLRKQAEGATSAMVSASKVAAGAAAAAYTLDRVVKAPMEYSLRLAQMANTAYGDRDAVGRIAGKRTLSAGITAAIRVGGGTRDDAAEALDTMIASGAVPINTALSLLPMLMRSSSASGGTAKGMSNIALSALQAGVKPEQIRQLLNMAMVAGQAGGFELKDMEKWLPSAIASGKGVGLTGIEGVRRLLASMQASVKTAGSKDEAGNNVVNLLNKINSEDTAKDFQKQGIDLRRELMTGVANGGNALDTFLGLVDRVTAGVRKSPQYKDLSARLKNEGDTGQETGTTSALRDLFQGTAISKVVQDRQALMALIAEMNNRDYVKSVMQQTRDNNSAMDTSFDVISGEVSFNRQRGLNEAQIGAQEAFDKAAPSLNAVADKATDLAQRFPGLTTSVMAATGAISVFTAALGAGGLASLLTGGLPGAAGKTPGGIGRAMPMLGRLGGWGLFTLGAYELMNFVGDKYVDSVKQREGVKFTAYARRRLEGLPEPTPFDFSRMSVPGLGGDYLSLSVPGAAPQALGPSRAAEVKIGEGRLDIRVFDDRVSASVAQPLSLVKINPGATNPAGYRDMGGKP